MRFGRQRVRRNAWSSSNSYSAFVVVDVTGHLGGFNFQWAWASGPRGRPRSVNRVRILHPCSCSSSAQRAYNASTIFCALAISASTFCSRT